MSKKSLLLGAIASVLTINSVIANQVITSQTYVDNADALKQDKITAGTTGNVVLYNGTQNGQTQFSERAIYDGTNDYDETTDANKLITAGAVDGMVGDVYDYVDDEISNIPAPELPTGTPDYVVTYDENGDIGGERGIYDGSHSYDDESGDDVALITAGAVMSRIPTLPTGTPGNVATYMSNGKIGGGIPIDRTTWVSDASIFYDGDPQALVDIYTLNNNVKNSMTDSGGNLRYGLATTRAVYNWAQPKMTCTRWIDNAAHTDANCLLWNMAN